MEQVKILTPSIAQRGSFSLDNGKNYYFVGSGGGGGGGYGITLKQEYGLKYEYVLGLLNSKLLDYLLKQISSPFANGYFAYNRQYIEQLPIRQIDFDDPADKARHDQMVALVTQMLEAKKRLAAAQTEGDVDYYSRRCESLDRQIDTLVYELYGLTAEEIAVVEGQ